MEAAWALHPAQRAAFEQAVIAELQKLPAETRGPGTLHRVIATCQRTYLGSGAIAVGPRQSQRIWQGRAARQGQIDLRHSLV